MIRIDLLNPSDFETYALFIGEGFEILYRLEGRSGTKINPKSFTINISGRISECVLRTDDGVIYTRIIKTSVESDDARDSRAFSNQNEPGNS